MLSGEPDFEPHHDEDQLVGFDFWSSMGFVGVQYVFMLIYFAYKITSLAHPRDTTFGGSLFARVTIYIGMVLSLIGIIYVQVDLTMTKSTYNTQYLNTRIWEWLVMLQLIYVWIVCPLTMVFYQSNESEGLVKRLFLAIKVQMPLFLTLIMLTVPTYIWLN